MSRRNAADVETRAVAQAGHYREPAPVEFRAAQEGSTSPGTITGHAIVFDRYSRNLGGFVEVIRPGAVTRTLQTADVIASHNHNFDMALGRRGANLELEVEDVGLRYTIELPATSVGRDVAELARGGIIKGSSFTFRTPPNGVQWGYTDQGFPLREVRELELIEVAPVMMPAYSDTADGESQVALRSLAVQLDADPATVLAAARDGALADLLRGEKPPSGAPAAATHRARALAAVQQHEADALSVRLRLAGR